MKESELEFYIIIKDRKMEISQHWYRDTLLKTNASPPVVGKIYIQYIPFYRKRTVFPDTSSSLREDPFPSRAKPGQS